jgi:hypothetical protein
MALAPNTYDRNSTSSNVKLVPSRNSSTTDNEPVSHLPSETVEMRVLRPQRRPTITQAERTEAAASAALGGQGLYLAEDGKEPESELFNPDGSATRKQRGKAFKALCGAGVITLITIWAAATWLFGSLYNAETRVHNLKVSIQLFINHRDLLSVLNRFSLPITTMGCSVKHYYPACKPSAPAHQSRLLK